jgi:hypothetical protein
MKYLLLILFTFIGSSCAAQMNNYIYYNLPENVTQRIEDHIENYSSKDGVMHFVAYLFDDANDNYVISIIDYNPKSSSESFLLLLNGIIEKSNRVLQVGEYEMPIMTSEDLVFADLGKTKMPDGRIAQKRVLMTFDGYTITFDRSGKIYED